MAPDGYVFWARDYAAIEARLVGLFARRPDFIRLASLGVHGFLGRRILGWDVDLSWSDVDLKAAFKELKKKDPVMYDTAKRVVYLSLYMGTPRKMHYEYPKDFPTIARASYLQDMFFDTCPGIRDWHKDICLRVDGTKRRVGHDTIDDSSDHIDPWTFGVAHAKNPFGYVHRFYNVLDWTKVGTEWVWSFGEDAKRLVSFLPQSTAAGVIKRAAKRMWYDFPDIGETLRLLIHDETFGECRKEQVDLCLEISQLIMEEPIPELPLDPSWGMGEFMKMGSEAKVGASWGSMN